MSEIQEYQSTLSSIDTQDRSSQDYKQEFDEKFKKIESVIVDKIVTPQEQDLLDSIYKSTVNDSLNIPKSTTQDFTDEERDVLRLEAESIKLLIEDAKLDGKIDKKINGSKDAYDEKITKLDGLAITRLVKERDQVWKFYEKVAIHNTTDVSIGVAQTSNDMSTLYGNDVADTGVINASVSGTSWPDLSYWVELRQTIHLPDANNETTGEWTSSNTAPDDIRMTSLKGSTTYEVYNNADSYLKVSGAWKYRETNWSTDLVGTTHATVWTNLEWKFNASGVIWGGAFVKWLDWSIFKPSTDAAWFVDYANLKFDYTPFKNTTFTSSLSQKDMYFTKWPLDGETFNYTAAALSFKQKGLWAKDQMYLTSGLTYDRSDVKWIVSESAMLDASVWKQTSKTWDFEWKAGAYVKADVTDLSDHLKHTALSEAWVSWTVSLNDKHTLTWSYAHNFATGKNFSNVTYSLRINK